MIAPVNFITPGQVHRNLITTNFSEFLYFYTNCYREWILNTFIYFWCFLELFLLGNLSWTLIMSMRKTTLAPGQLLRSVHMGKRYLGKAGYPLYNTEVAPGQRKLMWTVTGVRPCTEAKLTPGSVSCLGTISCPGIMWTGSQSLLNLARGYFSMHNWFKDAVKANFLSSQKPLAAS